MLKVQSNLDSILNSYALIFLIDRGQACFNRSSIPKEDAIFLDVLSTGKFVEKIDGNAVDDSIVL